MKKICFYAIILLRGLMKNKKILIVEDEPITAEDLKLALENLKYEIAGIEEQGKTAIERAVKLKPDIILMDVMLEGEIDGIETAMRIKKQIDVPIIYITAYADNDTIKRAIKTEPYGYIIKPFKKLELKSAIEIALHKHQKEKSLEDLSLGLVESKRSMSKRQGEIIEKAVEIISRDGIQNLTIKNIANEINVSLPAIYKHFKSKLDIMVHLVETIEGIFGEIHKKIYNLNNSDLEKIKIFFMELIQKFYDNSELIPIVTSTSLFKGEQSLNEHIYNILKKNKDIFSELIKKGQKNKEIRKDINSHYTSMLILGSINTLAQDWMNSTKPMDFINEGEKLLKTIINMIKVG